MSNEKSSATPGHSDLAFTRQTPYGSQAEPTYAGALSFLRRRYTKDLAGVADDFSPLISSSAC